MTRDDIIRIADECGALLLEGWDVDMLARFAKRVTFAAKGEMLIAGNDQWLEEARKAEREACAEICDQHASIEGIAQRCAAAIRGQA